MNNVHFTKHALKRARERKLWKYVNKKIFWFDGTVLDFNRVIVDNCVYTFIKDKDKIIITTMYQLAIE